MLDDTCHQVEITMRRKDVHCRLFFGVAFFQSRTIGDSISDPCVALQIEQAGWPRRINILKWSYQLYLLCDCMERGCGSVMTLL
jgi:hypothetical protein